MGYSAVELCLEHPDVAPRTLDSARCEAVAEQLSGLRLSSVSFHGKREHPALKAEYTRLLIDGAVRLRSAGAPSDTVVIAPPERRKRDDAREHQRRFMELVRLLRELCPVAADAGLFLAVEPEPDTVVHGGADLDRLLDAVGHDALRVNLDVGHTFLTEPDPLAEIRRLSGRLAGVHVEGMARGVHKHLLPGEGDLDLPAALATLWEVGYRRPVVVDLFDIQDDPPAHADAALRGLHRCLQAAAFVPLGPAALSA